MPVPKLLSHLSQKKPLSSLANFTKVKIPGFLVILTIILFLISLSGYIWARFLPAEIEGQGTLLSYEHQGTFDYTAYLKPSYLYGPTPTDSTEIVQYPTRIIKRIEFTYRYAPILPDTEVVKVDGILENPGVWEKRIKIFPYTSQTGDFIIRFVPDFDEIEQMYSSIERETSLRTSPHLLTFEVNITAPNNQEFIHSLPITISNTTIEIPADLTHSQACGSGEFHYKIYLQDNSIYGENIVIESPSYQTASVPSITLGPAEALIPSLIDSLAMTYAYQFTSDEPASEITSETESKLLLEALSLEEEESQAITLWSKEYPISSISTQGGIFYTEFLVDIDYYTEMINNIITETGTTDASYNLSISASTRTTAETEYGRIDETFTQKISGTVSNGIIKWNEELSQTQPGSIKTSVMFPNQQRYIGLSVPEIRITSTAMSGFLLLVSIVLGGLYLISRSQKVVSVDDYARQAIKKSRRRIVEAIGPLSTEGEKTIFLASIEDLITVAGELGKPIIHERASADDEVHSYCVADGTTSYRFIAHDEPTESNSD